MPKGIPKSRAVAKVATTHQPITEESVSDVRPSGRPKHEPVDHSPLVTSKVYIHAFSSGSCASLEAVPLHEVPLMRRKLETFGESLTVSTDWPDFVPRERTVTAAQLREEHNRLQEKYRFKGNDGQDYDLVQDLYGPAHQGRLVAVMRKQAAAWKKAVQESGSDNLDIETINDLVLIADPESDYIDSPIEA